MISTTRRCANADGLFAKGPVIIESNCIGAQPSDGICAHSQRALCLPGDRASAFSLEWLVLAVGVRWPQK
jgi:hypothetical protein